MFKSKSKNNLDSEAGKLSCAIRFLDDSEPLTFTYQKDTKGQEMFDQVCTCLDLIERDYFGLRYIDSTSQRHWLDLLKPVHRQLKNVYPTVLCFRVKFYPSNPTKLKEEITRYFLFLQLRRDLHHGRLLCLQKEANILASYIIQSELGDYDPEEHLIDYVSKFKMLPKQSHRQEEKIAELHKALIGQTAGEAEALFLQKCCTLDTYGVDPHPVKDTTGVQIYLGVTHVGIVAFQGSKKLRIFPWSTISKITFEGKMFIVHAIVVEKGTGLFESGNSYLMFGYKCSTLASCKFLWKCSIEQQYFFTLDSSKDAPRLVTSGGLFSRGSSFKFAGRCEKETYTVSQNNRDEPRFMRTSSNPLFAQRYSSLRTGSVPTTFNALGLSDESLDSLMNYKHANQWRSLHDFSTSSTPQRNTVDFSNHIIPEEMTEADFIDAFYNINHMPLMTRSAVFTHNRDSLVTPRPEDNEPTGQCDMQIQVDNEEYEMNGYYPMNENYSCHHHQHNHYEERGALNPQWLDSPLESHPSHSGNENGVALRRRRLVSQDTIVDNNSSATPPVCDGEFKTERSPIIFVALMLACILLFAFIFLFFFADQEVAEKNDYEE